MPKTKPATAASHGRSSTNAGTADGKQRYGLVTGGGSGGGSGARKSLGPAAALLDAKEREKAEREKSRADARRRRVMTPEEKMRRLREMEDDGTRNQVHVYIDAFRLFCKNRGRCATAIMYLRR